MHPALLFPMPRYPRSFLIPEGLAFHKLWRGHNKEWNLGSNADKTAYLAFLADEMRKDRALTDPAQEKDPNPLHCLTLMSNHSHECFGLENLELFSNLMRRHHGRYGQYFNRKHKRCGKVAQDRPKTIPIENDEHEMILAFYIHANPLRAGICKDAKDYPWSTHALFAFGKKAPWMENLKITFPNWYMRLGSTWQERQKNYRKAFDAYLLEYGLRKREFSCHGIGSALWVLERRLTCREKWRQKLKGPPSPG